MAQNAFREFIATLTAVRLVCSMPLHRSLINYGVGDWSATGHAQKLRFYIYIIVKIIKT